jgi:hypothetical protein
MDRFLIVAAYKYVAEHYYYNQWSKGYAKLSQTVRMGYREGLGTCWKTKGSPERTEAAKLLWKRRREIMKFW